jgi:hypothetical protein
MRMTIGGSVPGGMRDMARLAMATTSASAAPMSVPGKNDSLSKATCWMLFDSICWTPSTYWKSSSNWLTMSPVLHPWQLDPSARRSLLEAMIYFTRSRERTIFFSTHLLDDVERIADHVAVLDYSVLRACASADTFRERVHRLVARFRSEPPHRLPAIPGLLRVTRSERELSLIVANLNGRTEHDLEALGAESVDEQPISLEDALIAHVGRQGDKSFFLNTTGGAQ